MQFSHVSPLALGVLHFREEIRGVSYGCIGKMHRGGAVDAVLRVRKKFNAERCSLGRIFLSRGSLENCSQQFISGIYANRKHFMLSI